MAKFISLLAATVVSASVFAEPEARPGEPYKTEVVLAPEKEIKTASPTAGIVAEVLAAEGSFVRRGDPLLRLDDEQARLALERSSAVRNKLVGDYETAQRLFDEKLISRDEYQRAKLEMDVATTEHEYAAVLHRKHTIPAPADGIVFRILKQPGESVQVHEQVATVISPKNLHATAYLPLALLGTIQIGDKAEIELVDGNAAHSADVLAVDPVLETGSTVFRVKCLVGNENLAIRSGTRATAVFSPASTASAPAPRGQPGTAEPQISIEPEPAAPVPATP